MKHKRIPSHPLSTHIVPFPQVDTVNNLVFVLPDLLKMHLHTHTHIHIHVCAYCIIMLVFILLFSFRDLSISVQRDAPYFLITVLYALFCCIIIHETTPNGEHVS